MSRIEAEKVEAKIARILVVSWPDSSSLCELCVIQANFSSISNCKPGCQVLQAGLERFQPGNAVMLAERVAELDTVEQLLALWQHGSNVFSLALSRLDEVSLAALGFSLSGQFVELACHIRHYKSLRTLLVHLSKTECFSDIVREFEDDIFRLSCDKFG